MILEKIYTEGEFKINAIKLKINEDIFIIKQIDQGIKITETTKEYLQIRPEADNSIVIVTQKKGG